MLSGAFVVLVSFLYLGLLFAVAYWVDRRAEQGRSVSASPTIYTLSLAVYCTAWTYYGSVGRAAETGVGFLPTYLGPTIAAALWGSLLLKMIRISKAQRITSIADFIASRYGKSHLLGGLVTLIAIVGMIPYIALQLKAISGSFSILLHYPQMLMPRYADKVPVWADKAFYVALLLAAFTILFGTRHLDASERHQGMVAAIALESLIKLVAFTTLGLFVTFGLFSGFGDIFQRAQDAGHIKPLLEPTVGGYASWFSLCTLAGLAIILLPRQFQMAVVENSGEHQLRRAIWLFPLYLFLINIFVLPIALAGQIQFPDGRVDADTFVLTLPMVNQQEWLALLVFIGGLSAATGMVIVETIALSTMACNELVMPALLHRWGHAPPLADVSSLLLSIRRGAILVILVLGYLYFRLAGDAYALVGIGLISFSGVAQFAPATIVGLYWRGGTRAGALAGLSAGFAVWVYTLLLPSFAMSGWLPMTFLEQGAFGIDWLKPQALFGLEGLDQISHSLFWSLTANLGAFLGVSLLRAPNAAESAQATLFVDALKGDRSGSGFWRGSAEVEELVALAGRFLGARQAQRAFLEHARRLGLPSVDELPADARTVTFAETLLAGAIGGASARVMVSSVTQEEPLGLNEVLGILDEASQIRAYSRELEKKSQELQIATAELRAANERLMELDRMKDDFMSSVTHELRTPLSSIRAFSEILQDNPDLEREERARFIGIVVSETERLTRLVNQVLDLAKMESGAAVWQSEHLDLGELIRQSVDRTERLFSNKGAQISLYLPERPAVLAGDRDRLMQVILNLLSNAAKFVPDNTGRVEVRLREDKGTYLVSVADNGSGIPADEIPVIFEKFRQGSGGHEKPVGTGLGLPISRQIIEHEGGRIWAESTPGEGATFSFTLPKPPCSRPNGALPTRGESNEQKGPDRR